jgi:N-acetylmuramoyl-L-alanine amidase
VRLAVLTIALALLTPAVGGLAHAVERSRHYTVKPGDTLGAISEMSGAPLAHLMSLNNLSDPNTIVAGQALLLPEESVAQATSAGPRATREYVVRAGDSLSAIGANFGVSVTSIVEANNLANPDQLTVGQKLVIAGAQPSAANVGRVTSDGATTARSSGGSPQVEALLTEAAERHKLDASLVKAVAWYLSAWRPEAASPGGAQGVMQITTATEDWVAPTLLKRSVDRAEPRDNVDMGVAYLAYLINKHGDERQGVAAYLQGPASLARNGETPTTARAIDIIYASRTRFSSGAASPTSSTRQATGPASAPRDLNSSVVAAVRNVHADARVGAAARNLTTGGRFDLRAGEVFHSASVNKVPIMVEAFRQAASGKLIRGPSLNTDLERMVVLSDNEAANRLLDMLGEGNVNSTMAGLGLGSTTLTNYFSIGWGPIDPGFNQTSPADMARLFTLLATDQAVNASSSQEMRSLLLRAQDSSKLLRGLPPGTRVAHKSGWYNGVANDVGIVYAPRSTYVAAVFSEGSPDAETGNQIVAAVSKSIYEAWGR